MSDRFEDDRGVIQDLLVQPLDAVTEIRTFKGAIRGNHFHNLTTQWTYIVSGRLLIATQHWERLTPAREDVYDPGMMACEEPGTSHAWKALEDTVVLVFTKGPRSGSHYEDDTFRLAPENQLL